ncbi:MAG: hypothetical protein ACRD3O_01905 [Terriglobia bacterium]
MARKNKRWTDVAVRVALALVLLDALAYVALDRPLAGLLVHEQQRFTGARLQWLTQKAALARVERRDAALPATQNQVRAFLDEHIPARREGFSRAAMLIEHLTQSSGVQLSGISYALDQTETGKTMDPFEHLRLNIFVQGPFASLLGFEHELETASDFVVVRGFKFASGEGGVLGLRLSADLYLMP